MLAAIANYLTKTKIASQNSTRQKRFLSWNKVEKIALLIDEKQALNKSELDKFIEGTKKHVEVFYVELNAKQASYADWKCFTSKDKTFFKLPKAAVAAELGSKKYDVLVTVSALNQLFAANITSQIKASFKCGNTNLFGELDLIIERTNTQNLMAYLKEVFRYLEMIRTE